MNINFEAVKVVQKDRKNRNFGCGYSVVSVQNIETLNSMIKDFLNKKAISNQKILSSRSDGMFVKEK